MKTKSAALLALSGTAFANWNDWNNDVTVTSVVTNTKYVCPCTYKSGSLVMPTGAAWGNNNGNNGGSWGAGGKGQGNGSNQGGNNAAWSEWQTVTNKDGSYSTVRGGAWPSNGPSSPGCPGGEACGHDDGAWADWVVSTKADGSVTTMKNPASPSKGSPAWSTSSSAAAWSSAHVDHWGDWTSSSSAYTTSTPGGGGVGPGSLTTSSSSYSSSISPFPTSITTTTSFSTSTSTGSSTTSAVGTPLPPQFKISLTRPTFTVRRARRADTIVYVYFPDNSDLASTTEDPTFAAGFYIDAAGNLMSGGWYISIDTTGSFTQIRRSRDRPSISGTWTVNADNSLSNSAATFGFCVQQDGSVIAERTQSPGPTCKDVVLYTQVTPISGSTTSTSSMSSTTSASMSAGPVSATSSTASTSTSTTSTSTTSSSTKTTASSNSQNPISTNTAITTITTVPTSTNTASSSTTITTITTTTTVSSSTITTTSTTSTSTSTTSISSSSRSSSAQSMSSLSTFQSSTTSSSSTAAMSTTNTAAASSMTTTTMTTDSTSTTSTTMSTTESSTSVGNPTSLPVTSTTAGAATTSFPATSTTTAVTSTTVAPVVGPTQTVSAASLGDYQAKVLSQHNNHRANHSVAALTWSDTMADYAQQIAASCVYEHSRAVGGGQYGQNIGAGYTADEIPQMLTNAMYNNEINAFPGPYNSDDVDTSNFEAWGHFSQIIWSDTQQVGCYTQYCPQGLANTQPNTAPYFTVCNYFPAGNFDGQWSRMKAPRGDDTVVIVP